MSNIAIRVENLSKQYRIGSLQQSGSKYKSLREELTKALRAPIRRAGRLLRGEPYGAAELDETIWALRDVSFEVKHGEAVGIIGANGAGKTTLLKILSRITEPTEGRAVIYGRVGSLLEVGTGFHPELTGRENVYLSGAILGMKRVEIEEKFDEIVDFSGVEKFIDTPLKHYSSGMRVRLAFSVAAHLDPEILLIDEVLAVGDAEFRKKCLGKMSEVAKGGRTVLFVSHNMAAVENLCQRAVMLDAGGVKLLGTAEEVVSEYLNRSLKRPQLLASRQRAGNGKVRITDIQFRSPEGHLLNSLRSGQDVQIHLCYEKDSSFAGRVVHVGVRVSTASGARVFSQTTRLTGEPFSNLPPTSAFVCQIPRLPLPPSTYRLGFSVKVDDDYADSVSEALSFEVVEGDYFGSGRNASLKAGLCLVEGQWFLAAECQAAELVQ